MDIMKKRWLILIASCLVTLCAGSLYAWSVFATPMAKYITECTGQEVASLAIVFTVANSVGPFTMISGGAINDKIGPRWILVIGGLLFGAGMIGSGFVSSVTGLIITYGLGVGLGVGMVYGTIVSNAVKFFPDKAGLAGGLTTACYGGSSIIIPIIATSLLSHYTITTCFKIIGIVMMVMIILSAFVIEACPVDFSVSTGKGKGGKATTASENDLNWQQMLKQKDFYLMLIVLMCGAFGGMMIISQASPLAQNMMGFTPASAAAVVSILAFFNMMGRLASGTVSDKLGAEGTMRITFTASAIACILLYFCQEGRQPLFYIGLAIVGFCFGGIMGIYPGFTARKFGRKNNSVNYGIMFIGFALAGLFGPILMNTIHDGLGLYQPAFLVSAGLSIVGLVLVFVLSPKVKQK